MSIMQRISQDAISRRNFLQMAGLGGSMLLLGACGNSTSSGPITLTFWLPGGSQAYCAMHNGIEKEYEKSHPNVHMPPVLCGTGQQDFNEVLLARIAAGNPPDATVSFDTPVSLGARGALEPLDALMQGSQYSQIDKWPAGVLSSCQFGGKTYGLPLTAGTYGIWYNQEMFEKKGISSKREDLPKTWDEMRRLSKEFTHWNGDKLETAGFIPPINIFNDKHLLAIWSALNGSQIYDATNHKYTIDSEQNIAMMDFFVSWINEEYKGDINKVQRSGAWGGYPDAQGQAPTFQQSRLAMMIEGSWLMGDFYASIKPQFEKWNVGPLPLGPGGTKVISGYWPNWALIPHGSKHKEEAFKYLDSMSVKGIQTWFNVIPDLPANKDVPHTLVPDVVVKKRGKPFALDAINFFYKQQQIVTPMWNSPVQSFADDQIGQALDRVVKKAATPQQAMAEAQKTCQQKLDSLLSGKK